MKQTVQIVGSFTKPMMIIEEPYEPFNNLYLSIFLCATTLIEENVYEKTFPKQEK